jgi:hypothetical protein
VSSIDFPSLGAPNPQFLSYPVSGTTTGSVNGNEVTISVPLASLMGLAPGDKIDNVTAYGLGGQSTGAIPVPFVVDQAKSFSYVIGTPAAGQHMPDGYVEVSLDGFVTSTRATLNNANNSWTASIPSSTGGTVCARQVLAKDLYTPLWDDVQAGPVACVNFSVPIPVLTSVVSRMTHGAAGTFDVNLPLPPNSSPRGVECRSSTPGNYSLVFTFTANLTSVASASVSSGTGSFNSSMIGPNPNQYTVNLTGVADQQYITVTLNSVVDATGANGDIVSPQLGILVGDVNASARVDAADVSSVRQETLVAVSNSNFRNDLNTSGRIDAADVSIARQDTLHSLPSTP